MQFKLQSLFTILIVTIFISCKSKTGTVAIDNNTDTIIGSKEKSLSTTEVIDSSFGLTSIFFEKNLAKWAKSFKNFNADSFHFIQQTKIPWGDAGPPEDSRHFFEMYKGTLVYSPDSNQFIDLYSSNIWLEKRGKKIVAIADADQTVVLSDLKTKEWRTLAFFGPSAGIEEAVWTSSSNFILVGSMSTEDSEWQPIILMGDLTNKTMRWFEAKTIRPESSDYKASGLVKLKIDEWE